MAPPYTAPTGTKFSLPALTGGSPTNAGQNSITFNANNEAHVVQDIILSLQVKGSPSQ